MSPPETSSPLAPPPAPGSPEELEAFARLQARLEPLFQRVFPDPREPRTVVCVPSLSLDPDVVSKIAGLAYYEERLLCMLMLLRLPRTRVVYITSSPIAPPIVDYYLQLLQGVPGSHARRRLTLLACYDPGQRTLTEKVLARPRLMQRIRDAIPNPEAAHMSCFAVTGVERTLAVQLGIPIYGCDPALHHLGSKSGSRKVFKEAGLDLPDGFERLRDEGDVADALTELKRGAPDLQRAVVKLEEGTSGEGNAVFSYERAPASSELRAWIGQELRRSLRYESEGQTWEAYRTKFAEMGGIVEAWVPGERSPSVQCRIDPVGRIETISTHDQILGGRSGQVFKGCTFPAHEEYRLAIQSHGMRVAAVLKERSVLGRFGVDFVSRREGGQWRHYAIEVNLRKGGTTHTFRTLQFLTEGEYEPETGLFRIPTGQARFYYATDNLKDPAYMRLTPDDLIDIAVCNRIHFDGATQRGTVFHLIGALSGFGKLGAVCVGASAQAAAQLFESTVEILNRESAQES